MEDKTNIQLTAAEMSSLWTQYINDTLAVCVNKYFLEKVEDTEVRPVIEWTLNTAENNISIMRDIFTKGKFPIPIGFTDQDVNLQAPRLFSDTFVLMYLRQMSILAMSANGSALGLVTRPDVVNFHKKVLNAAVELQDKTRELMLKQGTYVRPPYISTPDEVDFVEKQHFLAGFFGKKRSLTSVEVTHLFLNIQKNYIGKALITGFAQTTNNKEVKQYLLRGKQLSQKYVDIFSNVLIKEDLPAPLSWDSFVSDSTTNVFSDKLIMFHISAMIVAGIGNFGMAMAASPRRDLGVKYASLIPEISLYAEDGANIMIKHGWMEEPPLADDREDLANG
ncbi:DUF3231 family protein [Metabacillus rhizolycopersici]|uniref:DUF3231 family protein n=1 Tax=Metabacillus rhizolycopersici TaxID=2875709 RepID=A0ABS7UUY0_9BACI|nr:DUF3231 family protein [Metabacillus rhizolycopersici]MBZ5752115.1 DUF3231 family protein [Metabacillus rhizolycopersici]